MRVTIVQPTVPSYRLGLFSRLADRLGPSFQVYASQQDLGVLTERTEHLSWERQLGPMHMLLPGIFWQDGALSVPVSRGDVVVISGAPRCLSNIVLLIKARLKGAKTIWWSHYWSSTSRSWRAGLRMPLFRLADAVLFYTDREVEEYRTAGHGSSRLVMALNNGIETDEIVQLRKPYEPELRSRDLLFIGRLTQKAGLDLLLKALAQPACAGVRLDVIGDGEQEQALHHHAANLGLADRISWHGGIADEARIAKIANQCRLFVYPGSVGLSLIHAFAYGLPAIVHDDRWKHMPEIAALRSEENGKTFGQGDITSLANVIMGMLADPEKLIRMSAAAVNITTHSFNATDMTERFLRVIVQVSAKH